MALKWVAGGSMTEAAGAFATIALAIVGLAGVFSGTMAAIATVVIGAAILIESGSLGAASVAVRSETGTRTFEMGEGASAHFLGGIAALVLGILALLGVASETLLSVAVLALGASLLIGSLNTQLFIGTYQARPFGGMVLIGLAGVVLGILAVIGLDQLTLVLVGLLSFGVGALFSGSALGARSLSITQ